MISHIYQQKLSNLDGLAAALASQSWAMTIQQSLPNTVTFKLKREKEGGGYSLSCRVQAWDA